MTTLRFTVVDENTGEIIGRPDAEYRFTGREFASRWLTVASATSEDPDAWLFYRSVNIELDEGGVRLTASDTTRLWTWWLGEPGVPAERDYAAERGQNVTVSDADLRARDLMRWVLKRTRKEDDPALTVTLAIGRAAAEDGQLIGLERAVATFAVANRDSGQLHETLLLNITEGDYPDLRHLFRDRVPAPVDAISFDPERLTKMVKALPWATNAPVTLGFAGPQGTVLFRLLGPEGANMPPLRGLLMPVRIAEN